MTKIDDKKLSSTAKKRAKIWVKQTPILEIGDAYYEVEPQPAKSVLEFQELIQLYVDYATQYGYLGTKAEEGEAEEGEAEAEKAESTVPNVGVEELRGLVTTIVKSPYHLLKPFVPDLEKEDADAAPWGQTWHNLSILTEINGLGWGEKLLKEYLVPFLPDLLRSLLTLGQGAVKARVSSGESGLQTPISSSTSLPENPTDLTPVEP